MSSASSSRLLPPPPENFLLWANQQPAELRAYLLALYRLSRLEISVTQDGVTKSFPVSFAGENALVQINL